MGHKGLCWLPLFLLLALILAPSTGATEEDVYAILYADKTLVFQYGNAPESGRKVTKTYPVNLNGGVSWSDKASAIKAVVFKDAIQPLSMAYWFNGFSSLESIQGLDKVDTSEVTKMYGLFAGCSKFTEMDLRGLDTSSVTDMSNMFDDCSRLTSLNLSGWDTSSVTHMECMFYGCSSLTALDISGWDVSSVTHTEEMFSGCSSLKTIYASEYFEAPDDYYMFDGCTSLVGGAGTEYDDSQYNYIYRLSSSDYARIDNPPDAPGYFTEKKIRPVR